MITVFNQRLLEFLGANIFDEKPFIVMPYLTNGNVRDYLLEHPSTDRLPIVRMPTFVTLFCQIITSHSQLHHISLGLVYLHLNQIVHGDLKAVGCNGISCDVFR